MGQLPRGAHTEEAVRESGSCHRDRVEVSLDAVSGRIELVREKRSLSEA